MLILKAGRNSSTEFHRYHHHRRHDRDYDHDHDHDHHIMIIIIMTTLSLSSLSPPKLSKHSKIFLNSNERYVSIRLISSLKWQLGTFLYWRLHKRAFTKCLRHNGLLSLRLLKLPQFFNWPTISPAVNPKCNVWGDIFFKTSKFSL